MKLFPSLLLWAAMLAAAIGAEPAKPIEALPLPDGRILRNATITAYRAMDVTIKHTGGGAVVRYEALPEAVRIEAEKKRPGGSRYVAGETAANAQAVEGQIFIQTAGAGPYKFGNVSVYAFAMTVLDAWKSNPSGLVMLPRPIGIAVTDADGKFKIKVPRDQPFFLFAQARRLMSDGQTIRYEWRAPSTEFKKGVQVNLSSDWRYPPSVVQIEAIP